MKKNIFPFLLLLMSCSMSKNFVGTYIETSFGDTLLIYSDKKYYYNEKLNTGFWGSTEGKWKNKGKLIYFKANTKALTGYSLKINKEPFLDSLGIELFLNNTTIPVEITGISIYKNGTPFVTNLNSFSENIMRVSAIDFDSLLIRTDEFIPLRLTQKTLQNGYTHKINILPVERLYELDKVPMRKNKTSLTTIETIRYSYVSNRFKKIKLI